MRRVPSEVGAHGERVLQLSRSHLGVCQNNNAKSPGIGGLPCAAVPPPIKEARLKEANVFQAVSGMIYDALCLLGAFFAGGFVVVAFGYVLKLLPYFATQTNPSANS